MSLLDGPDTVHVQLRTLTRSVGRAAVVLTNTGAPVEVRRVTCRPLTQSEAIAAGVEAVTQRVVVSRTWPGNINSLVIWDGFDWETIGDPPFYPGSRSSAHWEVRIQKAGPHSD